MRVAHPIPRFVEGVTGVVERQLQLFPGVFLDDLGEIEVRRPHQIVGPDRHVVDSVDLGRNRPFGTNGEIVAAREVGHRFHVDEPDPG